MRFLNPFMEPLAKALREFSIVSVYTDRSEPEYFASGFVAAVSEDYVILKHVTPIGRYDGHVIRRMDDIYRIDAGGDYENNLAVLYREQEQSHPALAERPDNHSLLQFLIGEARQKQWPVSVCIGEDGEWADIAGFIHECSAETVAVSRLGPNGAPDGESLIAMACISGLATDSEEERALALLARVRK